MSAIRFGRSLLALALAAGIALAQVARAAEPHSDEQCREDDAAEGWYVSDTRRGSSTSYLILHKKQQQRDRFYLCRLDGDARAFATELGMSVNSATSRIAATRCTPVETGVPGNEYFSVIDNATAQVLRVYRFDALEEDVETMSPDSVVCSALPAR